MSPRKSDDKKRADTKAMSCCGVGHFQVGSYRYRSLVDGLYTF